MSIKYPPYIKGRLPAQASATWTIPYEDNRSVSSTSYNGIKVKISNVQETGTIILDNSLVTVDEENSEITIVIPPTATWISPKEFYKIQLAYYKTITNTNNETVEDIGYYSTVGVLKYTNEPEITLTQETLFKATYTNQDFTERLYSYEFILLDAKGTVVEQSGIKYNNTNNDIVSSDDVISAVEHEFNRSLGLEKHVIQFNCVTTNNLTYTKSLDYTYNSEEELTASFSLHSIDKDNGRYTGKVVNNEAKTIIIERSENNGVWEVFGTTARQVFTIIDDTVEQNKEYLYRIREEDSPYETSEEVQKIDFDDMFLSDGERTLKVKFNPKVSTFKTTVLETKTDTLGSKYPFFFRNGNVGYKELAISGLISLEADDAGLFAGGAQNSETSLVRGSTAAAEKAITNETLADKFKNERDFKLAVEAWLRNGKPKLFRSPGEGNYIIRLMNVSLTPNDTLGRRLHTFTATGYEIADCTLSELKRLNLIKEVRWSYE